MDKKITVVIPTYKRPELLKRCIVAIIGQTFNKQDYEIIVVSDGPDTESGEIITLYAAYVSIKYIQLPVKKGPAAARNMGWLNAEGELIAFTDDDCLPDKYWLESIWKAYGGQKHIAFTGRVIVPLPDSPTDFELNTANLEQAEFVTANCACTKHALLHIGGFDERFSMAWREDSDLHFKLLSNNIPVIPIDAQVVHPVRKTTWGISIKEQKKGLFNALLYKKYPELYRDKIHSRIPLNYYAIIFSFIGILIGLFLQVKLVIVFFLFCWLLLLIQFTVKRLSSGSKSATHISEMLVTSMFIPFLSVYWQLYGAFKFRVLFIS